MQRFPDHIYKGCLMVSKVAGKKPQPKGMRDVMSVNNISCSIYVYSSPRELQKDKRMKR